VYTTGTLDIFGGTISNNTATSAGGIYLSKNATATISGTEISDNTATQYGGGLYIDSEATVTISASTTISGNSCGEGYEGSNIYNNGGTINYVDEIVETETTTESASATSAATAATTADAAASGASTTTQSAAASIEEINNTFEKYKAMLIRDIYDKNLLCFRAYFR
jgi:hypothetical protein